MNFLVDSVQYCTMIRDAACSVPAISIIFQLMLDLHLIGVVMSLMCVRTMQIILEYSCTAFDRSNHVLVDWPYYLINATNFK